jgi:hypothetical protein
MLLGKFCRTLLQGILRHVKFDAGEGFYDDIDDVLRNLVTLYVYVATPVCTVRSRYDPPASHLMVMSTRNSGLMYTPACSACTKFRLMRGDKSPTRYAKVGGSMWNMMMMMSFICSCRNKNQPKVIYPKGTSHHTRLFRGPNTIGMKK